MVHRHYAYGLFSNSLRDFYSTVNKDIVEEDDNKMTEIRPEYQIHGGPKGQRGITQPKRYDFELIVSMVSSESCFGNVL